MDDSIGVYIHIPFCKSKCYYCDFNSYSGREHLAGSYFSALKDEIVSRSAAIRNRRVSSVFIGGGTPSLVDPQHIRGLLEVCSKHLDIAEDAEVSMESNPGTLDYERLKLYRELGINRLSIGLQAWQDDLLKSIGRIHDRQQFIDNLNAAVEAGFDNINVDLIFGLPGQTFDDWAETLRAVTEAGRPGGAGGSGAAATPGETWGSNAARRHGQTDKGFLKHISCYSLKIEEGTILGDRLDKGTLVPLDDELDRRMYHHAVDFLAMKGYRHYEISNFACPGYECRHNLIYWKAREYAGFGSGAHSFLNSVRFSNVSGIEQYIMAVKHRTQKAGSDGRTSLEGNWYGSVSNQSGLTEGKSGADIGRDVQIELIEDEQRIDKIEAMAEFMILGMRLTDGVSSAEFGERFGESIEAVYGDKLDKLISRGLVLAEISHDRRDNVTYKLTKPGLDLANSVFVEFI
ncbi:MAG: radical SAM protein [Clostridiaceae bacterium]|nr:radical SAM protein [Clostridiaceae bacterium]